MKNVWKGMILGALAGAVAGAGLDRRAGRGARAGGLPPVMEQVPSAARIREGIADVADRVRDADVPSTVTDAAGAVRHKVEGAVADSKAAQAVREGAGKVAASSGELADVVRDKAGKVTAASADAVTAARSSLTGS